MGRLDYLYWGDWNENLTIDPKKIVEKEQETYIYVPELNGYVPTAGLVTDNQGKSAEHLDTLYKKLTKSKKDGGKELDSNAAWKVLEGKKWMYKHQGNIYRFATGGLADFTGPALLDGTTKKPEAVLNALQTKHFIQFVDVLDTLYKGAPHLGASPQYQNQKSGDATYNFHINVDKMTDDYDVDQMIKRIEEKIAKSNQYRSVTVVKKTN
jgi:hypothetical protein